MVRKEILVVFREQLDGAPGRVERLATTTDRFDLSWPGCYSPLICLNFVPNPKHRKAIFKTQGFTCFAEYEAAWNALYQPEVSF